MKKITVVILALASLVTFAAVPVMARRARGNVCECHEMTLAALRMPKMGTSDRSGPAS